MIFLPIILFFAVLYWDLATDVKKWRKEQTIYHTKEAWLRCGLLIPSTVLFTVLHPGQTVWVLVCSLLMQFFTFWFLFDGLFNRMRGFKWNQPPSMGGKDNSFFDRFYGWWAMIIKVTGMILTIVLYITTWLF